jgi:hypothetical protein
LLDREMNSSTDRALGLNENEDAGLAMSKARQFRQNAEACRQLARGHSRCTEDLLEMATIWELLAAEHEQDLETLTKSEDI